MADTMARLPSGTITFFFSDIEGSTHLLQRLGSEYAHVLGAHQRLLRAAFAAHGGAEVDTQGDSFFVAFPSAPDAVAAAAQATRALNEHPWPEGGAVRVRIGLHTGTPLLTGDRYIGIDVNRAARIAAAGHGGQILLSQATRDLAEHDLPPGATLRDTGAHRLKDLQHAEQLYQLVLPGLMSEFPPLKSLDAHPHNLPVQPTPLLGRDEVVRQVAELLRREDVRLVTLTGPGGIGKTRLAIQVAAETLDEFADGVWFVRLSRLTDINLVLPTIAQTLGLTETGGEPLTASLLASLRTKRLLLALDNFEQVVGAAPQIADLLAGAPGVTVLVTSRVTLHLRGEREFPLAPLPLPEPGHLTPPERLSQYGAVALFVERAQAALPDFAVTTANAPAIAEICARLDGLPLAIELAAARVKLLPPPALLTRLNRRLPVLTGGARDLEERQQTMRAAIAWSDGLLTPQERIVLRRLAVFVGGCTLDAAEAVCLAPTGAEPLAFDLLDGLGALIDQSLVQQREEGGEPRFGMLHIIREYALEQLEATQDAEGHTEAEAIRQAHLNYYLEMSKNFLRAEQATWSSLEMRGWFDRIQREYDNFRAALGYVLTQATAARRVGGTADGKEPYLETGLRLAGNILWFWNVRGYYHERHEWLEAFLALDDPGVGADAGKMASDDREALAIRARVLYGAGEIAYLYGEYAYARSALERSMELYRAAGDPRGLLMPLECLGELALSQGDRGRATEIFEQCLMLSQEAFGPVGAMSPLVILAELARMAGDLDLAEARSEESLRLSLEAGYLVNQADNLKLQALIACQRGLYEQASAKARKAIELTWAAGSTPEVVDGMLICAYVFVARERMEPAAQLFGAVEAHYERLGIQDAWQRRGAREAALRVEIDEAMPRARSALGEERWAAAVAAGRALSLDEAVNEAMQVSQRAYVFPSDYPQFAPRRK